MWGEIIKSKEAAKNHEAAMKLHIDRLDTRAPPPRLTLVRAATAASKKPLLGNYSEAASQKFLGSRYSCFVVKITKISTEQLD